MMLNMKRGKNNNHENNEDHEHGDAAVVNEIGADLNSCLIYECDTCYPPPPDERFSLPRCPRHSSTWNIHPRCRYGPCTLRDLCRQNQAKVKLNKRLAKTERRNLRKRNKKKKGRKGFADTLEGAGLKAWFWRGEANEKLEQEEERVREQRRLARLMEIPMIDWLDASNLTALHWAARSCHPGHRTCPLSARLCVYIYTCIQIIYLIKTFYMYVCIYRHSSGSASIRSLFRSPAPGR